MTYLHIIIVYNLENPVNYPEIESVQSGRVMCNNFISGNYRLTHRPTATIQWSRIQNISIGIIYHKIAKERLGTVEL